MKYSQPKRSFRFQGHAENVLLLCLKQQHIKLQLIGQLLSALCPAAGKNLAAVSIGHSFAEAMLHLPMPFFRLIRSFHNFLTSIPPGYPFAFSGEWFLRRKKYSIRFYATLQRFIIYQTFSPCQSFFAENLSISVFLSTIHRKGC